MVMNARIVREILLREASSPKTGPPPKRQKTASSKTGPPPKRQKTASPKTGPPPKRQKTASRASPSPLKGFALTKPPLSSSKRIKTAAKKARTRHAAVKLNAVHAVDRNAAQHLKGSQFRFLNELLYTRSSEEAAQMFAADDSAFSAYHRGFEAQRALWPEDPLKRVVAFARTLPKGAVVADFGCGDARLATQLPNLTVRSFDFVAANPRVTACDMRKTPQEDRSVDVAVFSLALMGTNCNEFIKEANRVLKKKGVMKIVEITSRIQRLTRLVNQIEKMGFRCSEKVPGDYFTHLTFEKTAPCPKGQLPLIVLNPCLYKKR